MKARLFRPWILFPYKSQNSSNFETFTAMTLKLQEVANFEMFFHVMQIKIVFMFVCNKNKDTPL